MPLRLEVGEQRRFDIDLFDGESVSGVLQDPTGRGLSGVELWLLRRTTTAPRPAWSASEPDRRVETQDDGTFELHGLQPGAWCIGLAPRSAAPSGSPIAGYAVKDQNFRLRDGEVPPPLVLVAHEGLVVHGRFVDADGRPLAGQVVARVADDPLVPEVRAPVAADGRFHVGPLLPCTYLLTAESADGRVASSQVDARVAGSNDSDALLLVAASASR